MFRSRIGKDGWWSEIGVSFKSAAKQDQEVFSKGKSESKMNIGFHLIQSIQLSRRSSYSEKLARRETLSLSNSLSSCFLQTELVSRGYTKAFIFLTHLTHVVWKRQRGRRIFLPAPATNLKILRVSNQIKSVSAQRHPQTFSFLLNLLLPNINFISPLSLFEHPSLFPRNHIHIPSICLPSIYHHHHRYTANHQHFIASIRKCTYNFHQQ